MRSEQDEVETELGTRSRVWIAVLSDKLPPCPNRAGASLSPAALVPAKCMYNFEAPDGKSLSGGTASLPCATVTASV